MGDGFGSLPEVALSSVDGAGPPSSVGWGTFAVA